MPDNAGYYYAAYLVTAVFYALYAVSIWWRARRISARMMERSAGDPEAQRARNVEVP
jgi:hypothetical protein